MLLISPVIHGIQDEAGNKFRAKETDTKCQIFTLHSVNLWAQVNSAF
jgi:hypothetical protein